MLALLDRDLPRRAALAAALRAAGLSVTEALDADEALVSSSLTVLLAPDRAQPGALRGVVARLRSVVPGRQVLAVTVHSPDHQIEREVLATAQAAGCDGCLVYAHPAEVVAVLRACVLGGLSCG